MAGTFRNGHPCVGWCGQFPPERDCGRTCSDATGSLPSRTAWQHVGNRRTRNILSGWPGWESFSSGPPSKYPSVERKTRGKSPCSGSDAANLLTITDHETVAPSPHGHGRRLTFFSAPGARHSTPPRVGVCSNANPPVGGRCLNNEQTNIFKHLWLFFFP